MYLLLYIPDLSISIQTYTYPLLFTGYSNYFKPTIEVHD